MVEQAHTLLHKGDTHLLGGLEDRGVVLAAGRGGDVLDTRAGSAEDVVDEGELKWAVSVLNGISQAGCSAGDKGLTKASEEMTTSPSFCSQASRSS